MDKTYPLLPRAAAPGDVIPSARQQITNRRPLTGRLLGGASLLLVGTSLWAAPFSGGSGTLADPYQIATLADLRLLSETSAYWTKSYRQVADIDAADTANWNVADHDSDPGTPDQATGFAPIGGYDCSYQFTGTYDGNGHTISNLYQNRIQRPAGQVQTTCNGMFSHIAQSGTPTAPFVKNLGLINVTIKGESAVGAIVGQLDSDASLSNVYAIGTVETNAINGIAGGLVGDNQNGSISDSFARVDVSGGNGFSGLTLGGLVGVQRPWTPSSQINNSYAVGTLSGNGQYRGGLVGYNHGVISHSLWDSTTSGLNSPYGGQSNLGSTTDSDGASSANMQLAATFTAKGWNFTTIWQIDPSENAGYPSLRQPPPPASTPDAPTIGTATVGAGSGSISVAFSAPANDGGAAVSSYTASCTSSDGGTSGSNSGTASPISVTGLSNGKTYTCTVTATNSAGTGSASSASGSVIPLGTQSITFAQPVAQNFGTAPTLTASSDSGLAVAFTSATSNVCTITSAGALTFLTPGSCIINANQAGNASYAAATQVQRTFAVNPVVPGAPGSLRVTASDGAISVEFSAPASDGGDSISSYTASCTSGNGGVSASGTGSSSPIRVAGLTNDKSYTCTVSASNSAGSSVASAASSLVSPVAPPPPALPPNPFNPAGNSTGNTVTNTVGSDLGGGAKVTPATASLISNLAEVAQTTGVSDNGVVVVTAPPGTPIKLVDNAPNGVLFSLPSRQNVPVQIQGQTVSITTATEQVTDSSGKPFAPVLATRTVTTPAGDRQQVLEVVAGQGVITASGAGQVIGALTLSRGDTLRTVTIADSSGSGDSAFLPGTAGFFKNPSDKSGAVSAEQGMVVLNVVLTPEGSQSTNRLAGNTAEVTRQLILQSGEVARFNAKGELIGVYAGSLSGTLGKSGDPLAVTAPAGVSVYPARAVLLEGNVLGRLGGNLLPAFAGVIRSTSNFAAEADASLSQDRATGIVTATNPAHPELTYHGLPVGEVTINPDAPDGMVWHTDGTVSWTVKGVSVTFAPMAGSLSELAASARQLGYATQVLDNGAFKLSGNATYLIGQPRFDRRQEGAADPGFGWSPQEQRAYFVDAAGRKQVIDPVPFDGKQLDSTVAGMSGWRLERDYFLRGAVRVLGPGGERFTLTPDYDVTLEQEGLVAGPVYNAGGGQLFYRFDTGFLPFRQGFRVQ